MSKIPTIEEIWFANTGRSINQEEYSAMIEFAKLHVEAALEAASEGQIERDLYMMREYGESMDWKSSIKNSYPLENIK